MEYDDTTRGLRKDNFPAGQREIRHTAIKGTRP
jgi:hypothetical protein